jgi:flavin reductase (DIM6/NTAB) family NADH-FMN oxidoreductase RutF
MQTITDIHEIETVQAQLLGRLINDWALLTVGTPERFNTMTIAWGSLGDMWWKPVIDCYVAPSRYTYGFMQQHDLFTVSFFPPEFKSDLQILGSESGRDGNKIAHTKLTSLMLDQGITFEQADTTLVCKKLYTQPLDPAQIPPEDMNEYYRTMEPHTLFMGQILSVVKA